MDITLYFVFTTGYNRIGIIGPGDWGRPLLINSDGTISRVTIYYHHGDVCRAINRDHLNPKHLTEDLCPPSGWDGSGAAVIRQGLRHNDLERVVEDNDFIILAVTMDKLRNSLII
jgi:glycerol-3-phosphate dehydrogenase (NAD(P)+)